MDLQHPSSFLTKVTRGISWWFFSCCLWYRMQATHIAVQILSFSKQTYSQQTQILDKMAPHA